MKIESTLVEGFVCHLLKEERAGSTVKSYRSDLNLFGIFLRERSSDPMTDDKRLVDADEAAIRAYVDQLKTRPLRPGYPNPHEPASIRRKVLVIKLFYSWLLKSGVIKTSPAMNIRRPRAPRKSQKVIGIADVRTLFQAAGSDDSRGRRDRAMIALICSMGMPPVRLVGFNYADLVRKGDRLSLRSGEREVPLNDWCQSLLDQYLSFRALPPSNGPCPLFLNKHGGRLSTRSVRRRITTYGERVNLETGICPRVLRRSFVAFQTENARFSVRDIANILTTPDPRRAPVNGFRETRVPVPR